MTWRDSRGQIFYVFCARYLSHVIYLECVLLLFIIYRSVHLTCIISSRDAQCQSSTEISETNNAAEFPAAEISTYDGRKLPLCVSQPPMDFRTSPRRLSSQSQEEVLPQGGNKKILRQITLKAGMNEEVEVVVFTSIEHNPIQLF